MTAYDYKNQVWREGVEGAKLYEEQLSETLGLLRGERGDEYAAFLGLKPDEAPEFIANLEKQKGRKSGLGRIWPSRIN